MEFVLKQFIFWPMKFYSTSACIHFIHGDLKITASEWFCMSKCLVMDPFCVLLVMHMHVAYLPTFVFIHAWKSWLPKLKKELADCNFNCRLETMFGCFVLVLLQRKKRWWDLGLVFWPEPMWYVLLLVGRLNPQSVYCYSTTCRANPQFFFFCFFLLAD